jgi:hypothetical protein
VSQAILLQPGARLWFDGELVEVLQVEANRVATRDTGGRWRTVALTDFLARARANDREEPDWALGPPWAALSDTSRQLISERAAHIREVLTGYRSETSLAAAPGEPRSEYDPSTPLRSRQAAKARELRLGERTIRRWVSAYTQAADVGLLDSRLVTGRGSTLDPRVGAILPARHGSASQGIDSDGKCPVEVDRGASQRAIRP